MGMFKWLLGENQAAKSSIADTERVCYYAFASDKRQLQATLKKMDVVAYHTFTARGFWFFSVDKSDTWKVDTLENVERIEE